MHRIRQVLGLRTAVDGRREGRGGFGPGTWPAAWAVRQDDILVHVMTHDHVLAAHSFQHVSTNLLMGCKFLSMKGGVLHHLV